MSSAPQSRKTFKISNSLNRQLNTYALAASAAGVSVLALARGLRGESCLYGNASSDARRLSPIH